jgi:hypothetical protein
MAIHSYSMPIRSYFLVIGPALAACLWFVGSALEPAPPPQARTGPAQAAQPAAPAASSALVTAARAEPQPLPQGQDRTPAEPTKPVDATGLTPAEPKSAEGTRSSSPPEATSREATSREATSRPGEVAKHKKRKQTAQRRQHRDSYRAAKVERGPYPAYASPYPYYDAPPQPFSSYRSW